MQGKKKQIICAVRGRPGSRDTVKRAIDLALEWSAKLTFLHIMDLEFLGQSTRTPMSVMYRELVSMGEFAMLILVDRARRRGVEDVDYVIREGNIRRQLCEFARETSADVMVIGEPRSGEGRSIFSPRTYDQFIEELKRCTTIEIIQVSHEEEVKE